MIETNRSRLRCFEFSLSRTFANCFELRISDFEFCQLWHQMKPWIGKWSKSENPNIAVTRVKERPGFQSETRSQLPKGGK